MSTCRLNRVLVIGAYLADRENNAAAISAQLQDCSDWTVDQRWAAIGDAPVPRELTAVTALTTARPVPKFELLNRLLRPIDLRLYQHLIVADDDIELPADFLNSYLAVKERHALSLAQPARTHDSYTDHHCVAQLVGVEARETRFVEIGPLFSIHRDAFDVLLPFDESAPMGWGLDFVWPCQIESSGLRMGIVDATPVAHTLRKPVSGYDYHETQSGMERFLELHQHLSCADAFVALSSFPPDQGAGPYPRAR